MSCMQTWSTFHKCERPIYPCNAHQTDILSKYEVLGSLEKIVRHAKAFKAAVSDQAKLADSGHNDEVMGADIKDNK